MPRCRFESADEGIHSIRTLSFRYLTRRSPRLNIRVDGVIQGAVLPLRSKYHPNVRKRAKLSYVERNLVLCEERGCKDTNPLVKPGRRVSSRIGHNATSPIPRGPKPIPKLYHERGGLGLVTSSCEEDQRGKCE